MECWGEPYHCPSPSWRGWCWDLSTPSLRCWWSPSVQTGRFVNKATLCAGVCPQLTWLREAVQKLNMCLFLFLSLYLRFFVLWFKPGGQRCCFHGALLEMALGRRTSWKSQIQMQGLDYALWKLDKLLLSFNWSEGVGRKEGKREREREKVERIPGRGIQRYLDKSSSCYIMQNRVCSGDWCLMESSSRIFLLPLWAPRFVFLVPHLIWWVLSDWQPQDLIIDCYHYKEWKSKHDYNGHCLRI